MEIYFCEHCGKRISPAEMDSGRCKRDGAMAWCIACTSIVAPPPPSAVHSARPPTGGTPIVTSASAQAARAPTREFRRTPSEQTGRHRTGYQRQATPGAGVPVPEVQSPQREKRAGIPPVYLAVGTGLMGLLIVLGLYALLSKTSPKDKGSPPETQSSKNTGANPSRPDPRPTPKPAPRDPEPVAAGDAQANLAEDLAALARLPGTTPRLLVRRPRGGEPAIDGVLDDACWAGAQAERLIFMDGKSGQPAAAGTIRLLATAKELFIAAKFDENELDIVPLPKRAHDTDAWADDDLEVFVLPGVDPGKHSYQWIVSIGGSTWDGRGQGQGADAKGWNPQGIRFSVQRFPNEKYWTVEAAIPLAQMPGAEAHALWRFNAFRNRPKLAGLKRPEEATSWAVLNSSSTHVPERFGVVAIEALGGTLP